MKGFVCMYALEKLCQDIILPAEVTQQVLELDKTLDVHQRFLLCNKETWEEGLNQVKRILGDDPDGFKMLTLMLHTAVERKSAYDEKGIPEEIYIASMSCFTRFVNEHLVSYGRYGFDRGFWTVRQLSLTLFRLGQLEYEIKVHEGQKMISIHIPSDSKLEQKLLRQSYITAKTFFAKYFPDYADVPYSCHSWLLSPNLKEILPGTSRIRYFQDQFIILGTAPGNDYRKWVFQRSDASVENLPQRTALQKNLKAFLLKGGIFHIGMGRLIDDPFV